VSDAEEQVKERLERGKKMGRGGLRSCLAILRTPFLFLLLSSYARIDRFYFTTPLFSFNSYPGLIAFCGRRCRRACFNGNLFTIGDRRYRARDAADVTCSEKAAMTKHERRDGRETHECAIGIY